MIGALASKHPYRPFTARAMSLLELLVVITILTVMMGVTFPTLRGFNERNKLRANAREIVALMRFARAEAVLGRKTVQVFFDLEKRQYWVDLREVDPERGVLDPKRKKRQLEQKRDLNQDVWFDEVTAYESNIVKDKIVVVDFYPDGSASPLLLTLTNRRGQKFTIEVLKSTGMTEVTAGTIEEKRAAVEQEMGAVLGAVSH